VAGFVLKKAAASALVNAIRAVKRGGFVLDPAIARDALDDESRPQPPGANEPYETLTDREKQVLKLVADGKSNKEIAALLGISVKTAMSHREHMMDKLDLHNRTDLVRFALRKGVLPPQP
jgi:DNA-binding NarL/FixJ family response regulator